MKMTNIPHLNNREFFKAHEAIFDKRLERIYKNNIQGDSEQTFVFKISNS